MEWMGPIVVAREENIHSECNERGVRREQERKDCPNESEATERRQIEESTVWADVMEMGVELSPNQKTYEKQSSIKRTLETAYSAERIIELCRAKHQVLSRPRFIYVGTEEEIQYRSGQEATCKDSTHPCHSWRRHWRVEKMRWVQSPPVVSSGQRKRMDLTRRRKSQEIGKKYPWWKDVSGTVEAHTHLRPLERRQRKRRDPTKWKVFYRNWFLTIMALRLLQWNCQGMTTKQEVINSTGAWQEYDIIALQESFLKNNTGFKTPGFHCIQMDSKAPRGGGLLTLVKNRFSYKISEKRCAIRSGDIEWLAVEVWINDKVPIRIINIYCPPNSDVRPITNMIQHKWKRNTVIVGDFNSWHPLWDKDRENTNGNIMANAIMNSQFILMNDGHWTHWNWRGPNTAIDLALTTVDFEPTSTWRVLPETEGSDHAWIKMELQHPNIRIEPPRSIRVRLQWNQIVKDIEKGIADNVGNVSLDRIVEIVSEAMVTNCSYHFTKKGENRPWWNQACQREYRKKKAAYNACLHRWSPQRWCKYKEAQACLKKVIKNAKRNFWEAQAASITHPNDIWGIMRQLRRGLNRNADSHHVLYHADRITTDPMEQANILVRHFVSASRGARNSNRENEGAGGTETQQSSPEFTLDELKSALGRQKKGAIGPDGIRSGCILQLAKSVQEEIVKAINHWWNTEEIPSILKEVKMIALLKPGKNPVELDSYRPISITSQLLKLLERLILQRIQVINNKRADRNLRQYFGIKHTGTTEMIVDILRKKKAIEQSGLKCGLVMLDIKNAYNTVNITKLKNILVMKAFPEYICHFVEACYTDRSIRMYWRGEWSDRIVTSQGLPQGSVLSPILFNLYTEDIKCLESENITLYTYADDVVILGQGPSVTDLRNNLQVALRDLEQWLRQKELTIQASKCAAGIFSRMGVCREKMMVLNEQPIQDVESVRILGMHIAMTGSWNKHVEATRTKALKMLNIFKMFCNKKWGAGGQQLRRIGMSTIGATILYGAPVLSLLTKSNIARLQPILNMMGKLCLGVPGTTNNRKCWMEARLLPLMDRIQVLSLRWILKGVSMMKCVKAWEERWRDLPDTLRIQDDIVQEINEGEVEIMSIPNQRYQRPPRLEIIEAGLRWQDKDQSPDVLNAEVELYMDGLGKNWRISATDGSRQNNKAGGAEVSRGQEHTEMYSYHHSTSSFLAELLTIGLSIQRHAQNNRHICIFTDSKATLVGLKSSYTNENIKPAFAWLQGKIQECAEKNLQVRLVWVPAHCGICINEKADRAAKQSVENQAEATKSKLICPMTYQKFGQRQREVKIRNTQRQIEQADIAQEDSSEDSISKVTWDVCKLDRQCSRTLEVWIARLRTGGLLTQEFLYKRGLSRGQVCRCAEHNDNIGHRLYKCPLLEDARKNICELYPNVQNWLQTEEWTNFTVNAEGRFPDWLKGCLLRNGPGLFKVGNDEYKHLFDGLALIHKFNVDNGNVTYQNHFLRSDTYVKNMKANRIVVSEFGTCAVPDPCKTLYQRLMSVFSPGDMTDNDAVNVSCYADQVYACSETNFIRKLDLQELASLDKVNLSKYVAVNLATAHPHYSTDGSVYNVGSSFTSGRPVVKIIKFPIKKSDSEMFSSGSVVCSVPSESRFYSNYYHSFGMTENYIILVEQPLMMSILGMITSKVRGTAFSENLVYYPDKETVLRVINRSTGELLPTKYTCKPFFVFHHINAYEDNGHVVVDVCAYDDGEIIKVAYLKNIDDPSYDSKMHCMPIRFVLPLEVPQSEKGSSNNLNKLEYSEAKVYYKPDGKIECHHEDLVNDKDLFLMELPTINYGLHNGRKYQYAYGIANFSSSEGFLVKVDVKQKILKKWSEPNATPSEAVFVPKPDSSAEDDGILLLSLLYKNEERKVSLIALDACSFEEIGRAEFVTESSVPGTFHGLFIKS